MNADRTRTVSVLIPTLNAAQWLPEQLEALHMQTAKIAEIVIIDSQSEDDTCEIVAADSLCRVMHVQRADFDHGAVRDAAARTCESDYLWFLTQDAIPADPICLEELLKAVQDESVACAYGRQLASQKAGRIEQLNREMNYPERSFVRTAADIPSLQIRAFFLSNTCCLYKRDIYLRCGGFQHELPTNEDMLMAASFLQQGYATAYCAAACVWHTHRQTIRQWYRRSFDIGAFMEMFRGRLKGVQALGEGRKYVFTMSCRLLREGRVVSLLHFALICAARLLGDRAGHHYLRFSEHALLRRTQNPSFWVRYCNDHAAAYTNDTRS